jgi:hypothetical protein
VIAETFWELLRDPAHWMFELFLMVVFDVIIGAILWPLIKRHIHRDIREAKDHYHDVGPHDHYHD